jgi:transposase InsO family protein
MFDVIGPLPESDGRNAILVIVDRFTKRIILEATTIKATSEDIAIILRDRLFRDHGLPKKIIHDRDTRFVGKFMTALCKLLGIKQNPSTAYHPQTDGQTEQANQQIEEYLRIFVNYHQDNWNQWLLLAEFSNNDRIHSATKHTPFFLDYGQHPWKGLETTRKEA